jgi:hypothetical protein
MYGTKISPIGSDESTMTASYFLSDALKNCTFEIEEKRYFYNEITYHQLRLLVSWGY